MSDHPSPDLSPTARSAPAPHLVLGAAFLFALIVEFMIPLQFFGWGGQFSFSLPILVAGVVLTIMASDQLSRSSEKLVTTGTYVHTRNPFCVGLILIYLGMAILLDTPLAILTLIPALMFIDRKIIAPEEQHLESSFGEAWRHYVTKTKRWL